MKSRKTEADRERTEVAELLSSVYGEGEFSRSIVGDIDDLLFTMRNIDAHMTQLIEKRNELSREELDSALYEFEIMVDDDLGSIRRDLLPPLKELRRAVDAKEESG